MTNFSGKPSCLMCRRRMRTQSEWKVEISGAAARLSETRFRVSERCGHVWPPRDFGQQRAGPLLHFAGRFFGERDGQDPLGLDAVADQLGDAIGDDARFAGAGSGENQQRPLKRSHCIKLGRVQVGGHRTSISHVGPESRAGHDSGAARLAAPTGHLPNVAIAVTGLLAALAIFSARS